MENFPVCLFFQKKFQLMCVEIPHKVETDALCWSCGFETQTWCLRCY